MWKVPSLWTEKILSQIFETSFLAEEGSRSGFVILLHASEVINIINTGIVKF